MEAGLAAKAYQTKVLPIPLGVDLLDNEIHRLNIVNDADAEHRDC